MIWLNQHMSDNQIRKKLIFLGILFSVVFYVSPAFASETNGTIDNTFKYAWGENVGWINFDCDGCNVHITDTELTGNAWSRTYGWINLNPTTAGIENTPEGILSGYAWSRNLGWINFTGVTINTSGEFLGYATLESDNSQINFNCANADFCSNTNFKVKTDWRPASVRSTGGASGSHPTPPTNPPPVTPPPPITPLPPVTPPVSIIDNIGETINSVYEYFLSFLKPREVPETKLVQIPKIAPFSLRGIWGLLPEQSVRSFVFAPLPYEIRILASKFPELAKTLKDVGINRFSDMSKLTGVSLNIPGLANILDKTIKNVGLEQLPDINKIGGVALDVPGLSGLPGEIKSGVGTGKIALIKGLPIAKFSLAAKKNLPAEFVFARTNGELVDLNVALSVGEKGEVNQQISSLPGKAMRLVVKPISKARSVTGYFVFKSATPKITKTNTEISRSSLTASVLFSMNSLVEKATELPPVENKLVLSSFEYTDPDHDGIYTADVVSPSVPGEYEVITVIDYIDPVLGTRQMRMITVIDPEGYVFEKQDNKETRIPSAIVSLYYLNNSTKKYEIWPAKEYQQENPQVTDIRGTYSFLVPEGSYYFQVEAPGYDPYQGKVFVVSEGSGIHQNIELNSGRTWLDNIDWKTILLFVVLILLVYNLYRNEERDKLSKLNKNE
jgi:hypothetical protein